MVLDERIGGRMRTVEMAEDTGSEKDGVENSREWKGGAERLEDVSWGVWLKGLVGMEVDDGKLKGWEQGNVAE